MFEDHCCGVIRPAVEDDFDEIMNIERRCFGLKRSYSKRQLRYLLCKGNRTFLVYDFNGEVKGFIVLLYRKGTRVAGLETMDVDPLHQGQGIGFRLYRSAEDEARSRGIKKIRLEVSVRNHRAINLYRKLGFNIVETLNDYYHYSYNGSKDALRMVKEL